MFSLAGFVIIVALLATKPMDEKPKVRLRATGNGPCRFNSPPLQCSPLFSFFPSRAHLSDGVFFHVVVSFRIPLVQCSPLRFIYHQVAPFQGLSRGVFVAAATSTVWCGCVEIQDIRHIVACEIPSKKSPIIFFNPSIPISGHKSDHT